MITAFKYRIYPTTIQKNKINFTIERCRLLYNRLLEERILAYKTEGRSLSYNEQTGTITERKKYIPELKQIHSQVLQNVAKRLDRAYEAFFSRVIKGKSPGFPRFKVQQRYNSFTYSQSGFSFVDNKLRISKIGDVRIKLHRQPYGKIKSCSITLKNNKYYACITSEVDAQVLPECTERVGIDLGLKHLAITSEGQTFDAPKHLRVSEQKLKELNRSVSRKKRGSNRRKKCVSLLAKLHEKVANSRKDYAHKVSRSLVNQYSIIAFEDLNIAGMIKNHNLAKSIADAGWGILVEFTSYKAESAGRRVVQVDPKGTSQTCSSCGEIVLKGETLMKGLSQRVHRCPHCGFVADRDENAALNILQRGLIILST